MHPRSLSYTMAILDPTDGGSSRRNGQGAAIPAAAAASATAAGEGGGEGGGIQFVSAGMALKGEEFRAYKMNPLSVRHLMVG